MESSVPSHPQCYLCYPLLKEHKILAKTLIKSLNRIRKSSNGFRPLTEKNPLSLLERVIRLQTTPKEAPHAKCSHQKWERVLKQLAYSLPEMSSVCSALHQKIAERSYHLWLLQSQLKNAIESISDIGPKSLRKFPLPSARIKIEENEQEQEKEQNNGDRPVQVVLTDSTDCVKMKEGKEERAECSGTSGNYAIQLSNLNIFCSFPVYYPPPL